MTKAMFMNNVSRTFHKVGFKLKKHSPEILVVTGVVGLVTSGVLACKATLKVNDVLEKTKSDLDNIHECMDNKELIESGKYSLEDGKKDLTIVYTQTAVEFVKLYGPAALLGAVSVTSILAGHNILRKRSIALAAAYTAVDNSFKEYRERVVERFGKDLDRELKYNIKAKEVEETVVDENGNETVVKKTVNVMSSQPSEYARLFDETCTAWTKDSEYNRVFLHGQQAMANTILQKRGHLFLNDVYEMLGMDKTRAGHAVGWVYDPKNPDLNNCVDFGIFENVYADDKHGEAKRNFINGYERSILLDFNVDGNVWDLMK
jgi:hypothetical protein